MSTEDATVSETVTMPRELAERLLVAAQAPDVIPHDPLLAGDLVAIFAQPQLADRVRELEAAIREHKEDVMLRLSRMPSIPERDRKLWALLPCADGAEG